MQTTNTDQLLAERQKFLSENSAKIYSFGLSTRKSLKNILNNASCGTTTNCFVTLCPIYDGNGGISGDYDNFNAIPSRYQDKATASFEAIRFLGQYIPLRVQFLLADRGILVDKRYNTENLSSDIQKIRSLYADKISTVLGEAKMTSFSEIGFTTIPDVCYTDYAVRTGSPEQYLSENGIEPKQFQNQIKILIKYFGETGAYYLIQNYLRESQFLSQKFQDNLIINVEACGPLNTLYMLGKNRAVDTNCVAKVNIRP